MTKQFGGAPNFAPNAKSEKWDDGSSYGSYGKYGSKGHGGGYVRCYESHPPLKLPGSDLVIYGGSCSNAKIKDADVYIGFDYSMNSGKPAWPWEDGHSFLFPITDMCAPSNAADFAALIKWTTIQLNAGQKVHAGCIGGHGRTGTFLAALVATMGETDAITYVREHYCKKAVESGEQIEFLAKHYGVKKVAGSKSHGGGSKVSTFQSTSGGGQTLDDGPRTFSPLHTVTSIWGKKRGKAG